MTLPFCIVPPGDLPTNVAAESAVEAVTTWAMVEHRNKRLKPAKVAVIDVQGRRSYFRLELRLDNTIRILRAFR